MAATTTLLNLPVHERPRERFRDAGPGALSEVELIALILGRGMHGTPVLELSTSLLATFGSLEGMAEASLDELQAVKGIGVAKAVQLKAWAELSARLQLHVRERHAGAVSEVTPERAATLVRKLIPSMHREHYVVVSLDSRRRVIGGDVVSAGTLDAALVHPRETFQAALRRRAAAIMLAHNHPSGSVTPSDEDVLITKRLMTAGKIMGIAVVDHIIVTESAHQSLRELGYV